MANEVQTLSNDIHVITAEINAYQRIAGEAIFEIGKRLKHVKECDLAHGEFGKWLDTIEMNVSQASRFIRVYTELNDSKLRSNANIGFANLIEIATLPTEQRDQPHTIPSTGESKTVDEMTVRELREVKAELKRKDVEIAELESQAKQATEKSLKKCKKALYIPKVLTI